MALDVQLYSDEHEGEIHHKVASLGPIAQGEGIDPVREFTTGCGAVVTAPYHRLTELPGDSEPGGIRCTNDGCYLTAELEEV